MEEGAGKRFSMDGLADLRVLMDALIPRVSRGARPGGSPATTPQALPRQGQHPGAAGTGATGKREPAGGPAPGRSGTVIRCLNPQTLGIPGRGRELTRKRVDRYYHRGIRSSPPGEIVRIPKILRGHSPGRRGSIVLQLEVRRRDGPPEVILPPDVSGFRERPWLPPGKGSRRKEAEA